MRVIIYVFSGLKKIRNNPRDKQRDNEEIEDTESFFENLEGAVDGEESRLGILIYIYMYIYRYIYMYINIYIHIYNI